MFSLIHREMNIFLDTLWNDHFSLIHRKMKIFLDTLWTECFSWYIVKWTCSLLHYELNIFLHTLWNEHFPSYTVKWAFPFIHRELNIFLHTSWNEHFPWYIVNWTHSLILCEHVSPHWTLFPFSFWHNHIAKSDISSGILRPLSTNRTTVYLSTPSPLPPKKIKSIAQQTETEAQTHWCTCSK